MNEWGYRKLGYPARVRDLLGPSAGGTSGGLNGTLPLNGTTVHDNQKQDTLCGAAKKLATGSLPCKRDKLERANCGHTKDPKGGTCCEDFLRDGKSWRGCLRRGARILG